MIDNPTLCTGEDLVTDADGPVLHRTGQPPDGDRRISADRQVRAPHVQTGAERQPDHESGRLALRAGPRVPSAADPRLHADAVLAEAGDRDPAGRASRSIRTPPTDRPRAATPPRTSATRLPACPDEAKIGTAEIGTPALDGPLMARSTSASRSRRPVPLFLILSGFGLNAKLVGSVHPDPQTGQLTVVFEELPQVPFETIDVHLFASNRGLMATPNACTLYRVQALFEPWNDRAGASDLRTVLRHRHGPRTARSAPVRSARSILAWSPARPTRSPAASATSA